MPATPGWLGSIEAMFNRNIDASAAAVTLARRLDGKSLEIEAVGLLRVRIDAVAGRVALAGGAARSLRAAGEPPADAVIRGSSAALLQFAASHGVGGSTRNPATAERGGSAAVQVRGDAEAAALFRELLVLARPDFEEEISRVIGDVAAHRFMRAASHATGWLRHGRATAGANLREYLEEESRALVNATELGEFLNGVDALREAADRVEARLVRLERRLQAAP